VKVEDPGVDATAVDYTEAGGTEAASPKALAEAAAVGSQESLAKQSAAFTASKGTPHPTAAAVLDKSDLARSKVFHMFGIVAPAAAIVMSLFIGGDPDARLAFWLGAGTLSIANIGLVYLTSSMERYDPLWVGLLWVLSTIGAQPAIYYFGPYSAVVMVDMLGIVFIALGSVRWTAIWTAAVCIVGHLVIAVPIMFGLIEDRGVMSSVAAERSQLWVAEGLIIAFLISGYVLGRWARRTNTTALSDLQSAMRVIGDQQQALAEVVDAEARQKRAAGYSAAEEIAKAQALKDSGAITDEEFQELKRKAMV